MRPRATGTALGALLLPGAVAVALASLASATAGGTGCSPDIGQGSYFCGPERLCPPDQECDDPTFTCDSPQRARPFTCPDGAQTAEPDDTEAQAEDAGAARCGAPIINNVIGCLGDGDEVDDYVFDYQVECTGSDPHLELELHYPYALMPLTVELVDDSGQVVATGEVCTPSGDLSGTEKVCIRAAIPTGHYLIRVRAKGGAPDCDGACHHNQYTLNVNLALS